MSIHYPQDLTNIAAAAADWTTTPIGLASIAISASRGKGTFLGSIQGPQDALQNVVHPDQAAVELDGCGVRLLPLHVSIVRNVMGLAGEQLVDVSLYAVEGRRQLPLVAPDAVEGAIQLGLAEHEPADLAGQVGNISLAVSEDGVVLGHPVRIGEKGAGIPVELGLELVEDLLDR